MEIEESYFDYGGQRFAKSVLFYSLNSPQPGFSEIYRGQWTNPDTNEKIKVSAAISLTGDPPLSYQLQVAIKLLRGVHTDSTVLTLLTRVSFTFPEFALCFLTNMC